MTWSEFLNVFHLWFPQLLNKDVETGHCYGLSPETLPMGFLPPSAYTFEYDLSALNHGFCFGLLDLQPQSHENTQAALGERFSLRGARTSCLQPDKQNILGQIFQLQSDLHLTAALPTSDLNLMGGESCIVPARLLLNS